MLAALLLAAACIPDPGNIPGFSTVTPTIRGDHDREDTVLFRIYAKEPDSGSWTWVYDAPYVAVDDYDDEGNLVGVTEYAPGILMDFPVQRMIPVEFSYTQIDFVIKAVDAANNESAPSPVVRICLPLCQEY